MRTVSEILQEYKDGVAMHTDFAPLNFSTQTMTLIASASLALVSVTKATYPSRSGFTAVGSVAERILLQELREASWLVAFVEL